MEELLHIRLATIEDAKMLFEWRNDEETRRASGTTALLDWDKHVQWLEKVLSGGFPGRTLHIVETGAGEPIGTMRSDERDDGFVEVSYTIAPFWRGKGMGKCMVLQFVHEKLAGRKIVAHIKKDINPASEAIARALGLAPFSEVSSDEPKEPPMVEWR